MRIARLAAVLLPILLLAGCGDDEPVTQRNFAPPDYSFLPKLRLNVGDIAIEDHAAPLGEADVAGQAPISPDRALQRMGHDRLFAAGTTGTAAFVIDQASILRQPDGTLDGQLAVHLDMLTSGGARAGYAEARVGRQHRPGSEAEDQAGMLYDLTKQMMDDMNIELEYQVKHTLKDWLVSDILVPAPVTTQSLTPPPPAQNPVPDLPGITPQQAVPQDTPPQSTPPIQMSPPPGYLQAPPGPPPS